MEEDIKRIENRIEEIIDYLSTNDLEKVCVVLTKMFKKLFFVL